VARPFVGVRHAFEQAPQLSSDVERLTHWLPQSVGASPVHPVEHAKPDGVGEQ
jgi:hypothetical protein